MGSKFVYGDVVWCKNILSSEDKLPLRGTIYSKHPVLPDHWYVFTGAPGGLGVTHSEDNLLTEDPRNAR